jgi:uncharacterized protein
MRRRPQFVRRLYPLLSLLLPGLLLVVASAEPAAAAVCKAHNVCSGEFCERVQTCCENDGKCVDMKLGRIPNPDHHPPSNASSHSNSVCKVHNVCSGEFCDRVQTCCEQNGRCVDMKLGRIPNPDRRAPSNANNNSNSVCKVHNVCSGAFCDRVQTCCEQNGRCVDMKLGRIANPDFHASNPPPPRPPAASGPSFSCTGNLGQAETVICSDSELSALDIRMRDTYERARQLATADEREALHSDQTAWVERRNNCRFEKTCIRNAYVEQLAALAAEIKRFAGSSPSNVPTETTVLGHNGSTIQMTKTGNVVEMRYSSVRSGLAAPVGALLFRGTVTSSGHIEGTAYTFKRGCPPAPYQVSGQQTNKQIVLLGRAPVHDKSSCDVVAYDPAAASASLVFDIAE